MVQQVELEGGYARYTRARRIVDPGSVEQLNEMWLFYPVAVAMLLLHEASHARSPHTRCGDKGTGWICDSSEEGGYGVEAFYTFGQAR